MISRTRLKAMRTTLFCTIGLGLLYALLSVTAQVYFASQGMEILLWPAGGIALAIILIGGRVCWPAVFLGAFIVHFLSGRSLGITMAMAGVDTLEPFIALWMLNLGGQFNPDLRHPLDILRLMVLVGLIGAGVTVFGKTWIVYQMGISLYPEPSLNLQTSAGAELRSLQDYFRFSYQTGLMNFNIIAIAQGAALVISKLLPQSASSTPPLHLWFAHSLGVVLIPPAVLIWRRAPLGWLAFTRSHEAIALFGLAGWCGQMIFLGWFHKSLGLASQTYWLFLFVTWGALRFGLHGVIALLYLAVFQCLWGISQGVGYFGTQSGVDRIGQFWGFFIVLAMVGMIMATISSKHRMALG